MVLRNIKDPILNTKPDWRNFNWSQTAGIVLEPAAEKKLNALVSQVLDQHFTLEFLEGVATATKMTMRERVINDFYIPILNDTKAKKLPHDIFMVLKTEEATALLRFIEYFWHVRIEEVEKV